MKNLADAMCDANLKSKLGHNLDFESVVSFSLGHFDYPMNAVFICTRPIGSILFTKTKKTTLLKQLQNRIEKP